LTENPLFLLSHLGSKKKLITVLSANLFSLTLLAQKSSTDFVTTWRTENSIVYLYNYTYVPFTLT
jgi:hypothetical protein